MEFIGYVASFIGAGVKWLGDLIIAHFAGFLSALLGTFVGAYTAFHFERREKQREVEEKNVGAINRGLYTIYRMWNLLRQYQRDHLEEVRDQPDRWLNLTSHPLTAHAQIQFEAGELSFLLTSAGNVFANIMLEEQRFKLAVGLIEQRTKLMLTEVFPRMERANVGVGQQLVRAEVERIIGIGRIHQLRQFTDQVFEFVDTDVASLEATFAELRAEGERLYPKGKFIRVDFNPGP